MKLNSNTTPSGKNNTNLSDTLNQLGGESWALYCLAGLGTQAAFNEVSEQVVLAHLFETLEKRLEALHDAIHTLEHSNAVKAVTAPQDLHPLLLGMLEDWRNLISKEGNQLSSKSFEASLEKAVSLASSLVGVKS